MTLTRVQRRFLIGVLLFVAMACHPAPPTHEVKARYLVTGAPVTVGIVDGLGMKLCIAVDAEDQHGVWWWEAGATGCNTRSTGPDVFRGDMATVSTSSSGSTMAAFRLQMHSAVRPFLDVRVVIEDGDMHVIETEAHVAVQPRSRLDVPFVVRREQAARRDAAMQPIAQLTRTRTHMPQYEVHLQQLESIPLAVVRRQAQQSELSLPSQIRTDVFWLVASS